LQASDADADHGLEYVFGFLEMALLFQIHREGEQRGCQQLEFSSPMCFARRAHYAAEVRGFRALARELGAVALGRGPLVAEYVRRWSFTIRGEQVDKAEREKRTLPQTNLWGSGRFIGHTLEENGVR